MASQPSLYISYRRSSKTIADTLHDALKQRGVDVFYDDDLPPGADFSIELPRQLRDRDVFMVILAPDTYQSVRGVLLEIEQAIAQGKPIIPVIAPGFDFNLHSQQTVIERLRTRKWVIYDPANPSIPANEIEQKLPDLVERTRESRAQSKRRFGLSDVVIGTIIAAIITGICGIIGNAVGILPDLLSTNGATPLPTMTETLRASDTPTLPPATSTLWPTETPTATLRPSNTPFPTSTVTQLPSATPTATYTNAPSQTSTSTPTTTSAMSLNPPISTRSFATPTQTVTEYPCEGTIVFYSSAPLNVVRVAPSSLSSFADPIQQGSTMIILRRQQETLDKAWYQIAEMDGTVRGWIPIEHVNPSASCPD